MKHAQFHCIHGYVFKTGGKGGGTHATLEGVKESFRTALAMHLKGMQEDGENLPEAFRGDYQLCFNLNTRALLHATEGIITRSALSKFTGIIFALSVVNFSIIGLLRLQCNQALH